MRYVQYITRPVAVNDFVAEPVGDVGAEPRLKVSDDGAVPTVVSTQDSFTLPSIGKVEPASSGPKRASCGPAIATAGESGPGTRCG